MNKEYDDYYAALESHNCRICFYFSECRARGYERCEQSPIHIFTPIGWGDWLNRLIEENEQT